MANQSFHHYRWSLTSSTSIHQKALGIAEMRRTREISHSGRAITDWTDTYLATRWSWELPYWGLRRNCLNTSAAGSPPDPPTSFPSSSQAAISRSENGKIMTESARLCTVVIKLTNRFGHGGTVLSSQQAVKGFRERERERERAQMTNLRVLIGHVSFRREHASRCCMAPTSSFSVFFFLR